MSYTDYAQIPTSTHRPTFVHMDDAGGYGRPVGATEFDFSRPATAFTYDASSIFSPAYSYNPTYVDNSTHYNFGTGFGGDPFWTMLMFVLMDSRATTANLLANLGGTGANGQTGGPNEPELTPKEKKEAEAKAKADAEAAEKAKREELFAKALAGGGDVDSLIEYEEDVQQWEARYENWAEAKDRYEAAEAKVEKYDKKIASVDKQIAEKETELETLNKIPEEKRSEAEKAEIAQLNLDIKNLKTKRDGLLEKRETAVADRETAYADMEHWAGYLADRDRLYGELEIGSTNVAESNKEAAGYLAHVQGGVSDKWGEVEGYMTAERRARVSSGLAEAPAEPEGHWVKKKVRFGWEKVWVPKN